MANPIIKIKRSAVAGKIPAITDLQLGELAINTYDGKVYIEQDQGGVGVGTTIITINPWSVGTGTNTYNTYFTTGNVGVGSTQPSSKLSVVGDVLVSGVVTASGGFNIGIQSSGINITTGVVTAFNFIGSGNTFNYNASTKTVDISISGGGGGGGGGVTSIIAGAGISVTQSAGIATITAIKYGDIKILDDISGSFNGVTTSFAITSSGGSISPSSSQSLIISIGGVVQKPGTDYYVSSNTIIFTTAPTSSLSFSGVYFNFDTLGSNGDIKILDDISGSFNGVTTSFAITSNSGAISPSSSQSLIISVGGVVQAPSTDYLISGSNLIFTTAPQTSLSFSGVYFNVNASDNTVTPRMLSTGGPWWTTNSNLGIGTTNPTSKLTVQGDALISGVVTSNGYNATAGNDYKINGTSVLTSTTLGSGVTNSYLTSVGTLNSLNVSGIATLAGNIFLGDNTADDINVGGEFVSNLNPNTTNSYDLGSSTQRWKDIWSAGTVTSPSFVGNLTGTASTASFATTSFGLSGTPNVTVGFITATEFDISGSTNTLTAGGLNVGVSTLGIATATNLTAQQLNVSGVSTLSSTTLIGSGTSSGTANQRLQVFGGASFTGAGSSVGIGTTNATKSLVINGGNGNISIGTVGAANAIWLNNSTATTDYNILSNSLNNLNINRPSGKSIFFNQADTTTHATFDTSNNLILNSGSLGINNVTPATGYSIDGGAASSNTKGRVSSLIFGNAGGSYPTVGYNANPSGLNTWTYDTTDVASWIQFYLGGHIFYRAASGTAPNSITALESARFDNTGNLLIGAATSTGTANQKLQVTGGASFTGIGSNVGIATTNPSQPLHVQGNARVAGAIYDSTNSPGTSGQVLQSTVTGTQWTTAAASGGGSGKFDTTIDNVIYSTPTGTLDRVGVGTTTSPITTLPSTASTKYVVHSIHVTNISNGDAEITAAFDIDALKVPAVVSAGNSGINTCIVSSASSITIGMAFTGTNVDFNTLVTDVYGTMIVLSKPLVGTMSGTGYFNPVSKVVSRLPVPVGSAVELLQQPFVLNPSDSIRVQSTGIGTVGVAATANATAAAGAATLTVASIGVGTITPGQLVVGTGIATNTYVGAGFTGTSSVPITRATTAALSSTAVQFLDTIVAEDGALQTTIVYQSQTDTAFQNGTSNGVGIGTSATVYYGTGNTYPSVIQSIRVANITDSGDYPVWVGIGNSDTIFSYLAYNLVVPKNSSIELCPAPKRIGIGQSIFAYSDTINAIEIQVAAKQKTS